MFSSVLIDRFSLFDDPCWEKFGSSGDAAVVVNRASLVFSCIFALLFFALSITCIVCLIAARGYALPFILLLVSLVCSLIQTIAVVVRYFANECLSSGSPNFPSVSSYALAFGGLAAISHHWSLPFFFLAFCTLLIRRTDKAILTANGPKESQNRKPHLSRLWFNFCIPIFVILFIMGIVASSLYIRYIRTPAIIFITGPADLPPDPDEGELIRRENAFRGAQYTFDVIWYLSTIFLGALAVAARKVLRESGLDVKVVKIMFYVAFPLHVLRVVVDFIFSIVLSTSGLFSGSVTPEAMKGSYLAENILTNGFHIAAVMVIIICGCRRSLWKDGSGQGANPQQQHPYPVQFVYPTQTSYVGQPVYQGQSVYTTQVAYPYPVQPNQQGQPVYFVQQASNSPQPQFFTAIPANQQPGQSSPVVQPTSSPSPQPDGPTSQPIQANQPQLQSSQAEERG